MTLIIVLLSLALERSLKASVVFRSFNWVDSYLSLFHRKLEQHWLSTSWQGLILAILPILLIIFLISLLVKPWYNGFGGFLFNVLVLVYCFGPYSFYPNRQKYLAAVKAGNQEEATRILTFFNSIRLGLADDTNQDEDTAQSEQTGSTIFVAFNHQLIAVLFWFVILGPVGAVLYRLTDIISQIANRADEELGFDKAVVILRQLLEWIPARILSFVYALVGNFNEVITVWMQYVGQGLASSDKMLFFCGTASSQFATIPGEQKSQINARIQLIFKMVDYALVVLLALLAVFSLGYWLS